MFFLSFSSFAQDPQTNSTTSDNKPTPIQRFIENLKNYKASQIYKNGPENKTIKPTAPELFENSVEYIIRGGMRGYVKSPGGSGKTGAYSHIIQGGIQGTDLKAIVVTPYKNLVKKKKNEIAELTNIDPANIGVYYSKEKDLTKQVTVITPNSFKKLVEQGIIKTEDYPIIMLDEVDNDWITAIGKKVIDNLPKSIVIGWTATAGDENQKEVSQILPDEIFRMTIREAIQERGLLKNLNVVVYTFDLVDISEADQGGKEYNQETLGKKQMEHEEVSRIGFDAIKLFTDDFKKPFIVNCTNIKLAKKIAEDWTKWGAPVEAVYSDDEDRENVLDRFESTETTGISNVRVMSRGYHNSKLGVVINFDPTLSYKKAEQRNRGSSFDKDNPDVENVVIEMVYANSKRDSNGDPIQILYSKVANGNPIYRKGVPAELKETTKKILKDKMEKSIQEATNFFGKPISVKALSSAEEVLALTNKISQKRSIFSASQTLEEIKKFNDAVKSGKLEKLIGSDNFKKLTQEILREERSLGNKNSTISNPMYLITGDNSYFRTRSIVGAEGKIWMSLSDLVISPQFSILGPSHGRRWQKISGVEFRIDKEVQYYINRYNRELDGGRLEQFLGTQNYAALKEKNFHELRIENANNYVKIFIYYGKSHGWFELSEINLHINGNFWNQFEKPAPVSQITPETHPLLFPKPMVDFDMVDRVTEVFPVVIQEDQFNEYVDIFVDGVKQKVSLSLLTARIVNSDLGTRATNILQAYKINYVGELVLMTKEELMSLRNFGNKTMKEIEYFLESQGLSLGSKIDEATKQIFIDCGLTVYDENIITDENEGGGKKVRVSVNGQETEVYLSDLVKPIKDTDIRVRAFNGVQAVGLKFLFELAIENDESLLRMKARNFGLKSIAEIKQLLKMYNLDFNTTFDDATIKTIYEYAKANDIKYILEKIESGDLKSRITNVQKISFDDMLFQIRNWNDGIMMGQLDILLSANQIDKVNRNPLKYFVWSYDQLKAAYKLYGKEAGWMTPDEFISSEGFQKLGQDDAEPWDKVLTKAHHKYLDEPHTNTRQPPGSDRVYEKEEIEDFARKDDWSHLLEALPNSKLSISVVKPIIIKLTNELEKLSLGDFQTKISVLKALYALNIVDDKLIYKSLVDLRNSPYLNSILIGEPSRLGKIVNQLATDLAYGHNLQSLLYNNYLRLSKDERSAVLIQFIRSKRISQSTADNILFAIANEGQTRIEDELRQHSSPTVTSAQVLALRYVQEGDWEQAKKLFPSKGSLRNLWQTERTITNSKISNEIAIAAYKAKLDDIVKLMEKQPGFSAADQLMDLAFENKDKAGLAHFSRLPSASIKKVIEIRDHFPQGSDTYQNLLTVTLKNIFDEDKDTPGKSGKDYRKRNGWGGDVDHLFSFMHPEDGPTDSYERDQRSLAGEGPLRPGQFGSAFGRGNEAMYAGGGGENSESSNGLTVEEQQLLSKIEDVKDLYLLHLDLFRHFADEEFDQTSRVIDSAEDTVLDDFKNVNDQMVQYAAKLFKMRGWKTKITKTNIGLELRLFPPLNSNIQKVLDKTIEDENMKIDSIVYQPSHLEEADANAIGFNVNVSENNFIDLLNDRPTSDLHHELDHVETTANENIKGIYSVYTPAFSRIQIPLKSGYRSRLRLDEIKTWWTSIFYNVQKLNETPSLVNLAKLNNTLKGESFISNDIQELNSYFMSYLDKNIASIVEQVIKTDSSYWNMRLNKVKEIPSLYSIIETELLNEPLTISLSTDSYSYAVRIKSEKLSNLFRICFENQSETNVNAFAQQIKIELTELTQKSDELAKWSLIQANELMDQVQELNAKIQNDTAQQLNHEQLLRELASDLLPLVTQIRTVTKEAGKQYELFSPQLDLKNIVSAKLSSKNEKDLSGNPKDYRNRDAAEQIDRALKPWRYKNTDDAFVGDPKPGVGFPEDGDYSPIRNSVGVRGAANADGGGSVPEKSYSQKAGEAIEALDSRAFQDAWNAAPDDEKNDPNLKYKGVGLWQFVGDQYARLISKNKYVTADAFYSDSNSTTHDFSDWVGDYFLSDEFPTVEFTAIETIIKTMLPKKLADRVLVGDLLVANPTYIYLESINVGDLELVKYMSKWMDETMINVAFAKSIKNKQHKIAEFLLSEYEISNKAFEVGKRLFEKKWKNDNSIEAKATRDILAKRIIVAESDRDNAAEIEKYFPELSALGDLNTDKRLTAAELVKSIRNGDDFKAFAEQHNYEQRRRSTKQIHNYADYLRLQEEFNYPEALTDGLEGEELRKLKAFLVLYDDKSQATPEVAIADRVNHPPKLGTNEYSKLAYEAIRSADFEKFKASWNFTNDAKHNPFLEYNGQRLWKLLQNEYFESLFVTVRDPKDSEAVILKYAKFREAIASIKRTDPVLEAQISILRKWIQDGNVKDKVQLKKIKNLENIIETIISKEGAYKFFDAAVYLEPMSFFKQAAGYDHLEDVKAMAPWMSEKSIHDALLFAAILKAPTVLEYLLQDKRVTDAMIKEAVTAANQDSSDVSAKALKCREILKHPRDIKIVKNGFFASESLEKLPIVGPIMKVINDLGFKASAKVNGLFFGKDSRPAIDQIEESIWNADASKFVKLWEDAKSTQNSTWFNENQKKLKMIAVNQYIEEIANIVDDSFKSYMDRKNIPSGVLLSPMQFNKWLSDRNGQLPEKKNKNRIDAINKILQSLLPTDVLQAFYNGQLNSNLEIVNVNLPMDPSKINNNQPEEKDKIQSLGVSLDWISETFTVQNASRLASNWKKGIVAGINHLIGREESDKVNLAVVNVEDENPQKAPASSNAPVLSIETGKKIMVTSTEAMSELRVMIGEMNQLGSVEAKEAEFEKNKTRFLALQDVLVKSRDHRVEVVKLLGSVSVMDRGLEHSKSGATTEFPKFFMASMLAQAVSHIGEDDTTPERSVDFTDQVMEMFKHNGMFALNASFAGVAFDTFVPLLSKKFESAYRAKVMKQMLTGAKTKSMQDILKRETSLMDGFARNQFTMFAATYLNLCIFGEKGMTWEEKLLQAGTSQVTFLAAQIVVRGGLLGALRASKVLEGMRVAAPADWVITTVVFSLDLIFQNWINRALGLEEQNVKLQDQVMRGYAAFHKGHSEQDFNYLVQSLSMYWDQVVMRGVQNVTYNYQKKQNEADEELSFIRQVEDGALNSYPMVGKEGATQEKRNELWRNYYIEAGEVQRKVKETLDPTLRSLIGEITNQQTNLSKTQQACKTMDKEIVQRCGMALINLPLAIEGTTRELLAKGFTTRSYQSPMEALQSITLIPDKYTTNDWVRLMVTIAKEGNAEQRLQMITLLQELLTRDLRVKPENFQVQEMEALAGYNSDLIEKYGNVDTKKHTVVILIPQGQDTKAKTMEAFLEMAYLKKCKLKNQVNPEEKFAKQYPKKRQELRTDPTYQVQKAKFIQQIQQAWFKDSLKLPDDRDWNQTRAKLKNQPEPPVIHVLQTLPGDRLGTPYTHHILTTPIFDVDLEKYENILSCSATTSTNSASSTPSRASFFH